MSGKIIVVDGLAVVQVQICITISNSWRRFYGLRVA
jgi:hypothetical protein